MTAYRCKIGIVSCLLCFLLICIVLLGAAPAFAADEPTAPDPRAPITRGEFLVLLLNAAGYTGSAQDAVKQPPPFADLAEIEETYLPYIAEGYRRNIMRGAVGEDDLLRSNWNQSITRQEAFTILGRTLNMDSEQALTFADAAEVSGWARTYISGLYQAGYLRGFPDGSFRPQNSVSRQDAASVITHMQADNLFAAGHLRLHAGSSLMGYKDGPRLESTFGMPFGLARASDGSLLVADNSANLIRQVRASGVSTLVGSHAKLDATGLPLGGYLDRVSGTEAYINGPRYLAIAANGDIYFSEKGNNVVRVLLQKDKKIYTFSGNGKTGYAEGERDKVMFNLPSGLAIHDGQLYVADTLNNCIRVLDVKGRCSLYAGIPGEKGGGYQDGKLKGEARFAEPTDIQFAPDGSLYVLDTGNSLVRRIKDGVVTTVAGAVTPRDEETGCMEGGFVDGPAGQALFSAPTGLFVVNNDLIYIADTNNHRVRKLEKGTVSTVAGTGAAGHSTGPALSAALNRPLDVLFMNNTLYISDSLNNCIMVVEDVR